MCNSGKLFVALFLELNFCIAGVRGFQSHKFKVGRLSPAPFQAPSPDTQASNVLSLTRQASGISRSAGYVQSLRKGSEVDGVYGVAPLTSVEEGTVFLTGVEFGTESFQAVVDTGSSDTWLAGIGFQCVNVTTGADEPESDCLFASTYTIEPPFEQIPDVNFNITYGDGEFLTGIFGIEPVTIAGITVKNQQVAVVDFAAWFGDGVSSGLIGFAFPSITSQYAGTNPTLDTTTNIPYNPVFTNMYEEGLVAPLFSLAIERSSLMSGTVPDGLLAIGGLPPVRFSPIFASAPFQLLTMNDADAPAPVPQYQFYTITTNGFYYEGSEKTHWSFPNFPNPFGPPTNSSQVQVIVDSGTTLIYLPTGIADAVNALFDPPAIYSDDEGAYVVDCDAKAPEFGVRIGEETFFINAEDLFLDNGDGTCISGVDDAGDSLSILGDVFLKNVLAVFDVGASEMRFAARELY
ncbi:MAG: hypothetical protein ALECFALPRED_006738 [Alectoria fallacina]|uniref:Peptidase A1 domain-containing protein n=1 Tax=Alectoria fallacina TaxID=1903189 RepID=A0A8H3IZW4_9LECA|nr:MAG: hypothetical protein ALECFALPRED_006738 [Alectoria fallacina]